MSQETPTPRTTAFSNSTRGLGTDYWQAIALCCQLERELNECQKERDVLQKWVKLLMEAQGIEEAHRGFIEESNQDSYR